jgi:DNA polymerase III epsilon subunit-like protein
MNKNTRNVMVDVESDGPCPGMHSLICFGAVIVEPGLQRTFYAELKPISEIYIPGALAISGFSREDCMKFPDPRDAMQNFEIWLKDNIDGRPQFWSDNPMFDAGFMNYYFWHQLGRNPFGWSAAGLGQLYKGVRRDLYAKFNHLRDTKHTHNPVDDAKGDAEAMLKIIEMMKTGNLY